jgi:hypothetical protein
MKTILLISVILIINNLTYSQTHIFNNNNTFDSLKIKPANPDVNDSIKAIIYISNENDQRQFYKGLFSNEITNDTIKLIAKCFED